MSQTTAIGALLFYFGWASTNALYGYFGVDTSVLGLSVTDYLLRSVRLAFPTLLILGLVTLCVAHLHHLLRGVVDQHPDFSVRISRTLLVSGVVAVAAGLVVAAVAGTAASGSALGTFVLMSVGFALIAYAIHMGRPRTRRSTPLRFTMVAVLAALCLIGAIGSYAGVVGRGAARRLADDLPATANVILYSKDDLDLHEPGVTMESGPATDLYRYRYVGLYLLTRSGGKYLLVPQGWQPAVGSVVVLPDTTDNIRLEFG